MKILLNIVTALGYAIMNNVENIGGSNVKADYRYSKPCVPITIGGMALVANIAKRQKRILLNGYDNMFAGCNITTSGRKRRRFLERPRDRGCDVSYCISILLNKIASMI